MILTAPTAIVLDETPLSLLTQKLGHVEGDACKSWYAAIEEAGHRFYVPEIADYELRRELLRAGKTAAVTRLDVFNAAEPDRYLPLTTGDVRQAARLWALARNAGRVGAPPEALDGDVLIAAQALRLNAAVVATANVSHLAHLVTPALWDDIRLG